MNTREALLRAVVEHPREDTPRLALADWLEEFGDGLDRAHAEFIRSGLAWANAGRREPHMDHSFTDFGRTENVAWWNFICRVWNCGPFPTEWWWIGGFVAGGEFQTKTFLDNAAAVFAAHPIERVLLRDRAPLDGTGWINRDSPRSRRNWIRPAPRNNPVQIAAASLPERLFRRLPGVARYQNWITYPTYGAGGISAVDALSFACVSLGRAEAGLGELK